MWIHSPPAHIRADTLQCGTFSFFISRFEETEQSLLFVFNVRQHDGGGSVPHTHTHSAETLHAGLGSLHLM